MAGDEGGAPRTWRAVLDDGSVRVGRTLVNDFVLEGADEVLVVDPGNPGTHERYICATALRLGWTLREIVPPGQESRAELASRLAVATRRAEEEREACAAVADRAGSAWARAGAVDGCDYKEARWAAAEIARAIRGRREDVRAIPSAVTPGRASDDECADCDCPLDWRAADET